MSLRFRFFKIPVKVHVWFLVSGFLLWQMSHDGRPETLAIWLALMFVGVLLHELGHALSGKAFGLTPNIELYGLGGVTWWSGGRQLTPGRGMLVSAAGPAVGIVLGLACLVVRNAVPPPQESLAEYAMDAAVWINLGWGVFNLFPMLPLDGGNIMSSFFQLFSKDGGRLIARIVSLAVIGVLLLLSLAIQGWFLALFMGYFGWINIRAMKAESEARKDAPLRPVLAAARDALAAGDLGRARSSGERLVSDGKTEAMRGAGHQVIALCLFLQGDLEGADAALAKTRAIDPSLRGAVLLARGDTEGALRHLEVAMSQGASPFTVENLCVALIRAGRSHEVVALFESGAGDKVSADAARRIQAEALGAGQEDDARRIGELYARRKG